MAKRSAYFLLLPTVALIVLGVMMLLSTGEYADANRSGLDFVQRQLMWIGVGAVACAFFALTDYRWWEKLQKWIYIGAAFLLVLCFVPAIGMRINGSARWIGAGGFQMQPSELSKIAIIIFLAAWYSRYRDDIKTFKFGFFLPLAFVGVFVALVGLEVDMGSAALIIATGVAIMFVAGCQLRYLGTIAALGLGGLVAGVLLIPNRLERILAFLDLEEHKTKLGLQQWQALLAFGSGGVGGVGLGSGRKKMFYLPYAHTDFIFPMVGEEMGVIFTLGVVFCYVLILVAGLLIALHARDDFGRLVGIGVVAMLSCQAALNIGVTTAVLPNKGLPLPFVSYGGSNLLCCLIGIGLLLSIYRHGNQGGPERQAKLLRARVTPRV